MYPKPSAWAEIRTAPIHRANTARATGCQSAHQLAVETRQGSFKMQILSELHDDILAKVQPGSFGGESNDGFLEHIVEIGRDEPAAR